MRSARTRPTHITFTRGLPPYSGAKAISPPTVGQPKQFPYQEIPETTPSINRRVRGSSGSPKRNESRMAIGRAPIVKMSRRMPPTPVAAPWYGSMKDGWLWLSILKTAARPSPDVHDAGVLAGPLDNVRRIHWELLEKGPRALIRTVLAPHHREHSEFGEIRFPAQESDDLLVFLLCQPMLGNKVLGHGDWHLRSHSRRHYEPGRASEHIVHSLWPRAARAGSVARLRSRGAHRHSAPD